MDPQNCFSLLVAANEAFGYTHDQTLECSLPVLMSMFREYNFMINEKNKILNNEKPNEDEGEWKTVIDYETGKAKKVRKVNSV